LEGHVGRFGAVRERIKANPASRQAYRVFVALVGIAVVATGLALLALPGPGLVVLFVGLAILGSEFHWARRAQRFVRDEALRWARWAGRQPFWFRLAGGLASGVALAAVVYLSLRATGVPDWTPDPLQRLIEG
jgi:uncharacterized protein (TIGR02611 family)